tara:strand:- start:468020 stop:468634 length:615 start_codon:yes stop_codon:yes gene_type:complete
MRAAFTLFSVPMVAASLLVAGCGGSASTDSPDETAAASHDDHDHDHEGHEHEGHDHEGHGHGDHDHDHGATTTIDADAAGLDADSLVSLDEPELPDNLADALTELVQLRNTIRDAFKADDLDAAHGPLHEIGRLLGCIESLVKDGGESAEHKEELTVAVDELFDSYTAVDETFHSDGGKEYSEVAASIDAAVKTLQEHAGHTKE